MYFANYFDLKEERKRFYNYFETIDQDRDGQLSFDELVKAYSFKVKINFIYLQFSLLLESN